MVCYCWTRAPVNSSRNHTPGAWREISGLQRRNSKASSWRMEMRYHTPLNAAEQRAHGLSAPQSLALADRVRYSEIDMLNHVNNKAYMEWFEVLRTEHFFRLCAPFYAGMAEPRTVLRSADIHYVQEMLAGQSYVATARVAAYRNTSYTVEQTVWADGTLRARMTGVLVMLHPDSAARYALPEALKRHFVEVEGAVSA